jgi:hypothetical protein
MLSQQIKSDIEQQWQTVRKLCEPSHRQWQAQGVFVNETRPEDAYNLPFVLAYAVLDQVLSELVAAGVFACKSWMLGAKMTASQQYLKWQNYAVVEAGRNDRNDLAHEAKLLNRAACMNYVNAVEVELKAWAVL